SFHNSPGSRQPAFASGHAIRYPSGSRPVTAGGAVWYRAFFSIFRYPGICFLSHPVPAAHISILYRTAHRCHRRAKGFPCSTHSSYSLAGRRLSPGNGGVLTPASRAADATCRNLTGASLKPPLLAIRGPKANESSRSEERRVG